MIHDDFGMHRAGIFLFLLLLLGVLVIVLLLDLVLTMRVLCERRVTRHQHNCAREYGCNFFLHFVWL